MNRVWVLFWMFFLWPIIGFGFTFNVTATPENCAGSGTLNFTVANTAPGGTIVYEIYELPNITVPIATVSTNIFTGLSAGNYRVIAKETVGTTTTSQQQDVTITNEAVNLAFTIQSFNQACSSNSNISVNVTSGVAVSYEIFSGPVTFPLQTSNTFSGLPVGVYRIRVFDNCGTGVVSTFTVTLNPTGLTIGTPSFSNTTPPSCTEFIASHLVTPANGTVIGYPLQLVFEVHPPGGAPAQTFTSSVANGDPSSEIISETIPTFPNQNYDYDVTITDSCGSVFTQNFLVNQNISLTPIIYDLDCNAYYFELKPNNYTPPYTLNFTVTPPGFNPAVFNADYPGPYNTDTVTFGGTSAHTPTGSYEVVIQDVCGRTNTVPFTIIDFPAAASALAYNNGCASNSGNIIVSIPAYKVVTAIILSAPASYPFPLPHDVTALVDTTLGTLTLNPVPIGDYVIITTNNCGDLMSPVNVTVPVYVNQGLQSDIRQGCDLNRSAIKIWSANAALASITITAAPASFLPNLPFDGTANIATDGSFYMNQLPQGTYNFTATDACNFTNTIIVTIVRGYSVFSNSFSLQANCGSFDIPLNYSSNGNTNETFWLQKLIDPTSNIWGHPGTEVVYPDGTVPNAGNSYSLQNNTTNYNLIFSGTFRIVHSFSTYHNGADFNSGSAASLDKECIEYLSPTLFFDQVLEILDVYRMPCTNNGNLDVVIQANGAAPIHYTIIEKDGAPFFLDNFNSNIFYNLPAGLYTYQLEDPCGNILTGSFDVNRLLSLITLPPAGSLPDILQCKTVITGNEIFDLSTQNAAILGTQNPANFTLSYHPSLADVQNNTNPILNITNYNPATNPMTVFVRLVYNPLPNCYETSSFELFAGQVPVLNANPSYLSCSLAPITLDVSAGNLPTTTYNWSDGSSGATITVSQPGITLLTVEATNNYGSAGLPCSNSQNIEVKISEPPVIESFEISDWTANENSITVITSNSGLFEYSLDGINFQQENTFSGLKPGVYTVYVQDQLGCGITQKEIWLLYYTNFFTPNNDAYHDTWFIENAENEPELTIAIFDRYGKLIKYLGAKERWDGTYNGQQAVSTDYWFFVTRADGRTHRGHFTLKR
ncbi:T9SS type B sorting domain-containing protein [Flavobacterium sp. CYK-4]|uniref:T9SS type B sorting domain-containing protein n=1 Tax=Flavobacterium lotistagni TaxID=2709660 RepID=UPI00140AC3E2|nr:T9SS type B sorting domain-containing protein [Flavobacterium lotistagni]NHM06176.1 T9SS type B sorting domain-containing protein [Flavobacterium lotistagni]